MGLIWEIYFGLIPLYGDKTEEFANTLFKLVEILENCTEENNTTIEEIKDILSKVI